VPHCDTCDRFFNPNTLHPDGTCPVCGRQVAEPVPEKISRFETEGAPWHFKVLIAVTVLYLGWRLIQGIVWVAQAL
jgi:rRNA maturation protein Nop10